LQPPGGARFISWHAAAVLHRRRLLVRRAPSARRARSTWRQDRHSHKCARGEVGGRRDLPASEQSALDGRRSPAASNSKCSPVISPPSARCASESRFPESSRYGIRSVLAVQHCYVAQHTEAYPQHTEDPRNNTGSRNAQFGACSRRFSTGFESP
jgi:hypothetical protein